MAIITEDSLRCSQEYCNNSIIQNQCHVIAGTLFSNCDCGASLIKCNNAAAEYFPLPDPDSNCEDNLFNTKAGFSCCFLFGKWNAKSWSSQN